MEKWRFGIEFPFHLCIDRRIDVFHVFHSNRFRIEKWRPRRLSEKREMCTAFNFCWSFTASSSNAYFVHLFSDKIQLTTKRFSFFSALSELSVRSYEKCHRVGRQLTCMHSQTSWPRGGEWEARDAMKTGMKRIENKFKCNKNILFGFFFFAFRKPPFVEWFGWCMFHRLTFETLFKGK